MEGCPALKVAFFFFFREMGGSACVVRQKEDSSLSCFLCTLILWLYVEKTTAIRFRKDLWRSPTESEIKKEEEKIRVRAGVAGRACEHNAVWQSGKEAGGEHRDSVSRKKVSLAVL